MFQSEDMKMRRAEQQHPLRTCNVTSEQVFVITLLRAVEGDNDRKRFKARVSNCIPSSRCDSFNSKDQRSVI
jgi:hypothetical protein